MRVRIVINHDGWWKRIGRTVAAPGGANALDVALRAVSDVWKAVTQTLCGLRGHDDRIKLQRMRMSLFCVRCGRVTPGWDLRDPTPKLSRLDRPRVLELLRRRS